jgi:hypothetical protein
MNLVYRFLHDGFRVPAVRLQASLQLGLVSGRIRLPCRKDSHTPVVLCCLESCPLLTSIACQEVSLSPIKIVIIPIPIATQISEFLVSFQHQKLLHSHCPLSHFGVTLILYCFMVLGHWTVIIDKKSVKNSIIWVDTRI